MSDRSNSGANSRAENQRVVGELYKLSFSSPAGICLLSPPTPRLISENMGFMQERSRGSSGGCTGKIAITRVFHQSERKPGVEWCQLLVVGLK